MEIIRDERSDNTSRRPRYPGGADVPKQFIEVLGRPVLSYTIERFQNTPRWTR